MNTTSAAPRLLAVLLAVSLAGNAALLLRDSKARRAGNAGSASAPATPGRHARTAASSSSSAGGATAASPEAVAALSRAFSAESLTEFRKLLEAAGVEPKLRRELLQIALSHRYEKLFRGNMLPYEGLMLREWWRDPSMEDYHPAGVSAKRRQEDSLALSKQFNAELADLVGEDLAALDLEDPDNAWTARRFSGLPKEKALALHRIERDYQELEQEIHARSSNFLLPSDQEKLRLLKEEQERDVIALLTPEERAEWQLRASPTADRARNHATRYRATEDEYRRIYALQKTFDDTFEEPDPFAARPDRSEQDWQARQEAEKALAASIRAIVGDERMAEARRQNSSDFTLAQSAAERLGLPADTADRLYALREPAAEASRRIATDTKLTPDEKKAALARLATDTRATLQTTLGAEAASAYVERGGMNWLRALEEGTPIQFAPDNDGYESFTPEPLSVPVIRIE